jgi:5-methylcytosine-specific restriction protein A
MEKLVVQSETDLMATIRKSDHFKLVRDRHFPHKVAREEEAWKMLLDHKGRFTPDNLRAIFDKADIDIQNRRWFGQMLSTPNQNLIFQSPPDLLNRWVDELLFTDHPIEKRLRKCLTEMKIKGASKGLATFLLYLSDPKQFNVWVNATEEGLVALGRIDELTGKDWGANYLRFNKAATSFRDDQGLKPREVDWFLSYIRNNVESYGERMYPLESFSWKLESEKVAIKTTDKSCFCHHGTGIPAAIYRFFGIDEKPESADWNVLLLCQGIKYNGHLQQDITLKRWRLFWKAEFDECLRSACPDWYAAFQEEDEPQGKSPLLRFFPLNDSYNAYEIEIILQDALADDGENGLPDAIPTSPESFTSTTSSPEGGKKAYQGTRYERDLGNRRRAIEIHGTRCTACQFDFGETYGSHGIGFIEIHHLHPLYVKGEEHPVDPKEDLRPICSNCHRMIHRKKQSIMTIEALKELLRQTE